MKLLCTSRDFFYPSRHDEEAAKAFDRPRIEKPVTRQSDIESNLYEQAYFFADQDRQFYPRRLNRSILRSRCHKPPQGAFLSWGLPAESTAGLQFTGT